MGNCMATLKALLKKLRRRIFPKRAVDAFNNALIWLKRGDTAIDCGANVGNFTLAMAATGATVHAFEPDPVAFEKLKERTAGLKNVKLYNAAVSNEVGSGRLYLHEDRGQDPLAKSVASSLVATKTNVNTETFVSVELVRLSDFVTAQGVIKVLKMDIEGHEIEVLNDMIDTGAIRNIKTAFVELHDRKNPQLAGATQLLRERIRATGVNFDLTWH